MEKLPPWSLDAAFDNLKDKPGSESVLLRRLREKRADVAANGRSSTR